MTEETDKEDSKVLVQMYRYLSLRWTGKGTANARTLDGV